MSVRQSGQDYFLSYTTTLALKQGNPFAMSKKTCFQLTLFPSIEKASPKELNEALSPEKKEVNGVVCLQLSVPYRVWWSGVLFLPLRSEDSEREKSS